MIDQTNRIIAQLHTLSCNSLSDPLPLRSDITEEYTEIYTSQVSIFIYTDKTITVTSKPVEDQDKNISFEFSNISDAMLCFIMLYKTSEAVKDELNTLFMIK